MSTEQRKLVSVVFADVVGSTAFGSENDPEAVRSVMASYYERMKAIAELHGGTVEKFIGDAVMVVFGMPRLHDDDAERAVRAALAMRDAMVDLNRELGVSLAARVGVNSGEAVAGGGGERQFLVTGDPVNVAARLQQGAEPGEVVVGPLTESLTRVAVEYERREPVTAKGKSDPITAFRALRPRSAIPDQARGLPAMRAQLVGRQRELRLLLDTFERVRTERRAHLFTLVGNAGIGKSRLVGEVLARIAGAANARVLRGRCLPYGAGITYWPLMEIVRDDAGIGAGDDREAALDKLGRRVSELAGAGAPAIGQRLAAMLGLRPIDEALADVPPANVAGEIAWAMREHLAAIAREPAVIVIDDLQWAEPAVFEILEALAERAEDAPLLLLCVARPQLLETHAGWAAGRANAATITLDALSADETTTLISRLLDVDDLPADLRARIVQRSEGNPLFCEEFLRMLIDEGRVERTDDRWRATASAADVRVPETIHALIAARLDGLGDEERRTMQVASIVGERFSVSEVSALAPDLAVPRAIAGLRRSGFVLEDRETRTADRYRFKHLLMRDVAYSVLPKAARANLHEAYARELERTLGDRGEEYAEILAHHVERAFALSVEVRAPRAIIEPRARAALDRALTLGERARRREDLGSLRTQAGPATATLAALAGAATPEDRIAVALLVADERRLSAEYDEALAAFDEAARMARSIERLDLAARAHLGAAGVLVWSASDAEDIRAYLHHATEAARLFHQVGDFGGEIEAGLVGLEELWARGEVQQLITRGVELARRASELGDGVRELRVCARLVPASLIDGRLDLMDEYQARADALVTKLGVRMPGWARVAICGRPRLSGDLEAARACYRELEAGARSELNSPLLITRFRNEGELLALELRRYEEAEEYIDQALELSVRAGEQWSRAELLADKAVIVAGAGDITRADTLLAEADERATRGDVFAVAYITMCRARVHELAGRTAEADAAHRLSTERFAASGFRRGFWYAAALLDQAEFLATSGRPAEAAQRIAAAESVLVPQTGARAERIARLRADIEAVISNERRSR